MFIDIVLIEIFGKRVPFCFYIYQNVLVPLNQSEQEKIDSGG